MVTNQTTINLVFLNSLLDKKEQFGHYDPNFISDCIQLLLEVPSQPIINPLPNGLLQWTYATNNKKAELELHPDGTMVSYRSTYTGVQEFVPSQKTSVENIRKEIDWLKEEIEEVILE